MSGSNAGLAHPSNAAGSPPLAELSYLRSVAGIFNKKQEELEEYLAYTDRYDREDNGPEIKSPTPEVKGLPKYLHRIVSRGFHLSDVTIEEMADLIALTADRIGNSFLVLKPLLALLQWSFDLNELAQEKYKKSLLLKTFFSTCILGASTLAVVVALGGAEVMFRALAAIQMVVAGSIIARSLVDLYRARKEKVENKKLLEENTKDLASLAKELNTVAQTRKTISDLEAQMPNYTGVKSDLQREIDLKKQSLLSLESSPRYQQCKAEFTQKLQERLELEEKRGKIKKEMHHSWVDLCIGLNNILAAGVALFVCGTAGLGMAGLSIGGSIADFIYMSKQRKAERLAKDGVDPENKDEARQDYYSKRLVKSLELEGSKPKKNWFKRLLSLGSSRTAVSQLQKDEIKQALGLLDGFREQGNLDVTAALATTNKSELDKEIQYFRGAWVGVDDVVPKGILTQAAHNLGHGKGVGERKPGRWEESVGPDSTA